MPELDSIEPLPRRQVTPAHRPDSQYVAQLVNRAAYSIHCAIAEETGSTHDWSEATEQYREGLRRQVRRIVNGEQ